MDLILSKLSKPSWLSTEFVVTAITVIVGQLVALGWISTTSSVHVQQHIQAIAQVAVLVVAAVYTAARSITKYGLAKTLALAGKDLVGVGGVSNFTPADSGTTGMPDDSANVVNTPAATAAVASSAGTLLPSGTATPVPVPTADAAAVATPAPEPIPAPPAAPAEPPAASNPRG